MAIWTLKCLTKNDYSAQMIEVHSTGLFAQNCCLNNS